MIGAVGRCAHRGRRARPREKKNMSCMRRQAIPDLCANVLFYICIITILQPTPTASRRHPGARVSGVRVAPGGRLDATKNIQKSCVLHVFYKHFAAGADSVRAAPRGASRRRPGSVRAASERRSGNVRATSARCPGGIRAVAGRRPIRRQAIQVLFTNVLFLKLFFQLFCK